MRKKLRWPVSTVAIILATLLPGATAQASVVQVGPAFFAGDPITTFDGLATDTDVNGLTSNGILFNYILGGNAKYGRLAIDGGPGVTNHISPPNINSEGNNAGTLLLTLPTSAIGFGYGYALLANSTLADATTIALFNGTIGVGGLTYSGSPDPNFTGGFAGIESTLSFNRVAL